MNEKNNRLLDREKLLETLTNAATSSEPSNILLAGPWGSGKTTLLRQLQTKINSSTDASKFYVIWFSPWDTLADGNSQVSFLRVLRDELTLLQSAADSDPAFKKRLKRYLKVLKRTLNHNAVRAWLDRVFPCLSLYIAPIADGLISLSRAMLDNADDSKEQDTSAIKQMRKEMHTLLKAIAAHHNKERILLLVDDLDRARPEEAVATLDSLYHLIMPWDQHVPAAKAQENKDKEDPWPLTSVWAVNTAVLEELLYREYREMPSFDPNAYLEKLFGQRINVPPLFHFSAWEGGPQQLWQAELEKLCPQFSVRGINVANLAKTLADAVNYSILGNLRLHARVRRDCCRLWENRLEDGQNITIERLVREARLMVLVDAFAYFREHIAPFNGMWPHFLNQMNKRLVNRPMEWIANPLYRHVDSPDLATLLVDLGVLRYNSGTAGYELIPEGRKKLQGDLNDFWKYGV